MTHSPTRRQFGCINTFSFEVQIAVLCPMFKKMAALVEALPGVGAA
jgi:hypothetical protein